MFSFFKRSKKDTSEAGGNNVSSSKEKRGKDKVGTKSDIAVMCKNSPGQRTESVETSSSSSSSESRLPENVSGNANAVAASPPVMSETTAKSDQKIFDKNHSDPNQVSNPSKVTMESRQTNPAVPLCMPISYANALKVDTKPVRSGVKPCGHGTVAIAPKVPDLISKRELCTPPSSPEMGSKPKYSKVNVAGSNSENAVLGAKQKLKGEQQNGIPSDTVRASLKLQFEVPKNALNVANKFGGDASQYARPNHNNEDMYVITVTCVIDFIRTNVVIALI